MELSEALSAAFDTASNETVETESAAEARARDESGRFARVEPYETVEPSKSPAVDPAAPVIDPAAQSPEEPKPSKAPSSWKKEVAAIWDKADRGEVLTPQESKTLLQEAERREGDFHKGIEGWRTHAEKGKAYEGAIAPFQETLQKLGIDGVTAVTELLKADHILRNGPPSVKAQKLMELAQQYGIDLNQQYSPDIARYEQELFALKQQNQEFQRSQQEQSQQSLNSDIERFKAAPNHEHFETVRGHMAALLQGGSAKDLDEAYDMAVYANPQTRAAMLEQQRREAAKTAVTQRASTAAASVRRGSSPAAGGVANAGGGSIREALSAAYDQT